MYWSRVKTILIILFLCINIFLLVSMMVSVNRTITISSETVEDTVQVLKKNNIEIEKNIIPTKMHNLPLLEMVNPEQDPKALAAKILGDGFKQQGDKYTLDKKTLAIRGCEFSYSDEAPSQTINDLNELTAENYAKKELEKFGAHLKYAVTAKVQRQGDEKYSVTFYQEFSGREIFENYITVILTPQGLISMEGYWLIPKKFTTEKLPIRHVTGILIDFLRNDERPKDRKLTVTDISLGYHRVDPKNSYIKETTAIPAWRITTDDGQVYYYEATTGNYIKNSSLKSSS
ncbi:MAG: hypothetical protein JG777_2807 [Clostridia bacterium]|nr:hypothetical protein [Clostridia bacterium]